MKNIIKSWLFIIIMAFTAVSFTACSNDEPDDNSVIGTWRNDYSEGYQQLSFEKNGKFIYVEVDPLDRSYSYPGIYTQKDKILTLKFEDGDIWVYTILSLTSEKMSTRDEDDYYEEWYRVK